MTKKTRTSSRNSRQDLLEQIKELRAQLEEAEQTLSAIRNGGIDALVIDGEDRARIYTLEGPDFPYRSIVETMAAGAVTLNEDYTILYCNTFFSNLIAAPMEQVIGSSFLDFVPVEHRETFVSFIRRSYTQQSFQELPLWTASSDKKLYMHLAGGRDLHNQQNVCIAVTDISARKQIEESLDIKSRTLEDVNTALRVLLKQREEDKSQLEENILSNVKELILPYIERLKKSRLDVEQATALDIVNANLEEITSPIGRTMHLLQLSPKEIDVIAYLKAGKNTKQIAESLGLSQRTVEFHRYNIRRKLGLDNKKTNLRSYLLSLR